MDSEIYENPSVADVQSVEMVRDIIKPSMRKDALKLLEYQALYLKYMKQEQLSSLFSLIVKTDFKKDVLVNLNYLRAISGKLELTESEIDDIKKINQMSIVDDKEYLIALLNTGIIDVNELYQLIVIHEQRHNFQTDYLTTFPIVDSILKELKTINTEIDLTEVDKIAVFGSTYSTQKQRLIDGLEYYKQNKDGEFPEKIYLLSGFRRMYISELLQLDVISQNNLDIIKARYRKENNIDLVNVKIQDLIDFVLKKENEDLFRFFNITALRTKFKQIVQANLYFSTNLTPIDVQEGEHFKDLKMDENSIDQLTDPNLLQKFSKCSELNFFKLAAYELELSPDIVLPVYSTETSGTNIMNGPNALKSKVRRANTQDTLKSLFNIDADVQKILYVSNEQFVPQQHNAVLDVLSTSPSGSLPVKIYGASANAGNQTNIAARHFPIVNPIAKWLGKEPIDSTLLSGEQLRSLDKIIDPNKAYLVGRGKKGVQLQ